MSEAVFIGMPLHDRTFEVGHWGNIRCGGPCKDDYARIKVFHDAGGRVVVLQAAALESFRSSEQDLGFPIVLTGSHRACSQQRTLWLSDPNRFANPDTTAHTRGLAIDVSTAIADRRKAKIKAALTARHWHQARPVDEPWHWSFGIQV